MARWPVVGPGAGTGVVVAANFGSVRTYELSVSLVSSITPSRSIVSFNSVTDGSKLDNSKFSWVAVLPALSPCASAIAIGELSSAAMLTVSNLSVGTSESFVIAQWTEINPQLTRSEGRPGGTSRNGLGSVEVVSGAS